MAAASSILLAGILILEAQMKNILGLTVIAVLLSISWTAWGADAKDAVEKARAEREAIAKERELSSGYTLTDPPDEITNKDNKKIIARGTITGEVVDVDEFNITVKSSVSGKTAIYIPIWKDKGPDPVVTEAISKLSKDDKVEIKWFVNDHLRIETIRKIMSFGTKNEAPAKKMEKQE